MLLKLRIINNNKQIISINGDDFSTGDSTKRSGVGIAYKNQIANFVYFDVDARRFAPRDSP
jgi:hypothetical protein